MGKQPAIILPGLGAVAGLPGRVIPVREMLGELLMQLKQPKLALAEFEISLANDPNRFSNLYGAAHAARQAGERPKARRYYRRLLDQVGPDSKRPEIKLVKSALARP